MFILLSAWALNMFCLHVIKLFVVIENGENVQLSLCTLYHVSVYIVYVSSYGKSGFLYVLCFLIIFTVYIMVKSEVCIIR